MFQTQLFSFFFISLFLPLFSNGADTMPFAYCPLSTCHGHDIKYPFWRLDYYNSSSPHYCGYPGFGINCSQNDPIIYISNDSFSVKHIDYSFKSLTLVDIDVLDNLACPRARHNLTLEEKLPLKYSELDMYLIFYYNCTHPLPSSPSVLDCLRSGDNMSYFYAEHSEPESLNWYGICEKKVVATVMDREWTNGLSAALGEGFVLDWQMRASEFVKCEASDGRCGYNNSTKESLCFCKDGSIMFDNCTSSKVKPSIC